MTNNKQKLELTWIGKNNPEYDIANIEPRILEENPELSNCANDPNTENMIIHGDNLLALKALLPEYEGKIKCIYIDPPYNTGNAFEYYDDSVEHSTWLSLMKPRLELLRMLLKEDGIIFIQIDDVEQPYLRVLMDEVFGRNNFINTISVNSKVSAGASGGGEDIRLKKNIEYILVYCKETNSFLPFEPVYKETELMSYIARMKDDEKSFKYTSVLYKIDNVVPYKIIKDGSGDDIVISEVKSYDIKSVKQIAQLEGISENEVYIKYFDKIITTTNAQTSIRTRVWDATDSENNMFIASYSPKSGRNKDNKIDIIFMGKQKVLVIWLKDTATLLKGKIYKKEKIGTYWDGFSWINVTKEGGVLFPNGKKPESLLQRIIRMSTNEDDIVLDSFLGSGTTCAVAHKMRRRYLGIEMGDHAFTHCKVRLDKVISGLDQGGISKTLEWQGGGAYKFYELAPSFIIKDEFGNPIIDDYYNDTKLIKAMCKLMNFTYQPSQTEYWKHGMGQGKNYLYVTTQLLTCGMVQQIVGHLSDGESLIICPKKFEPGAEKIDSRITIKKIPQSVLKACHFGKKEYLLPIKETAMEELENDEESD
ncbi:MAG: site-specific DNA-methyltransferase [Patescibacteria group bacterium]|jgi:adenine-specific DNA-methyltransferase